jgi:hypothetical protein
MDINHDTLESAFARRVSAAHQARARRGMAQWKKHFFAVTRLRAPRCSDARRRRQRARRCASCALERTARD